MFFSSPPTLLTATETKGEQYQFHEQIIHKPPAIHQGSPWRAWYWRGANQAGYNTTPSSMALTPTPFPRITHPESLTHAVWAERSLHAKKTNPTICHSEALPAKIHILVTCPFCSLRTSSFILALSLSFLGYNSKILAGSQSTFEINFFSAPRTLSVYQWFHIPGRPHQLTHKPQCVWPPLVNLILRAELPTSQAQIPRFINFMDH